MFHVSLDGKTSLPVSFVDVTADETGPELVAVPRIGEPCLSRSAGRLGVVIVDR